jgi:hypothetical protein
MTATISSTVGGSAGYRSRFDQMDAVIETVERPDHVEPDALPARTRFYRRNVGPSRWLMAVVSYEQQPARIITALANRKDPRRWKP